jgi:hypothetical protein
MQVYCQVNQLIFQVINYKGQLLLLLEQFYII